MKIPLDTSIFRDYDIRGIYPVQINKKTYYLLGRALAQYIGKGKISVGRDTRLSSPELSDAIIAGILDQGIDVTDLGLISTEMNYFASGKFDYTASLIVSASHNPPQYNGLKIVKASAIPLHGNYGLPQIKLFAQEQNFGTIRKKGSLDRADILDAWVLHALKFIDIRKLTAMKIVMDASNGMGGIAWKKIMDKLPVKIFPLYFEPDGNFPHHLPDPSNDKNLTGLKKEIKRLRAGLGFAFDGDSDRIFLSDENGDTVSGTITTAILASILLKKYGPAPVLYNVVCGRIVPETIKKLGGTPIRVRVGHSFIKQAMRINKAVFAGEHSGHFYYRDNYYADSAFITGLILLEFFSSKKKKVSQVIDEFDKYPDSGEINFKITTSASVILDCIANRFKDADSQDRLDGLSVFFPQWWFNLRSSKTEPYVRLNVEADNQDILENKVKYLEEILSGVGGTRI